MRIFRGLLALVLLSTVLAACGDKQPQREPKSPNDVNDPDSRRSMPR